MLYDVMVASSGRDIQIDQNKTESDIETEQPSERKINPKLNQRTSLKPTRRISKNQANSNAWSICISNTVKFIQQIHFN